MLSEPSCWTRWLIFFYFSEKWWSSLGLRQCLTLYSMDTSLNFLETVTEKYLILTILLLQSFALPLEPTSSQHHFSTSIQWLLTPSSFVSFKISNKMMEHLSIHTLCQKVKINITRPKVEESIWKVCIFIVANLQYLNTFFRIARSCWQDAEIQRRKYQTKTGVLKQRKTNVKWVWDPTYVERMMMKDRILIDFIPYFL